MQLQLHSESSRAMLPEITVCRLCNERKNTGECIDIFECSGSDKSLGEKIAVCLHFSVSQFDHLPKRICPRCLAKVEDFYTFFENCHKVQSKLQEEASRRIASGDSTDPGIVTIKVEWSPHDPVESASTELETAPSGCSGDSRLDSQRSLSKNDSRFDLEEPNDPGLVPVKQEWSLEDPSNVELGENATSECNSEEDQQPESDSKEKIRVSEEKSEAELGPRMHRVDRCDAKSPCEGSSKEPSVYPRTSFLFQGYEWCCTICEDAPNIRSFQELCDHYKGQHGRDPVFKCMCCDRQYFRYQSFARHFKLHQNPKKFPCEICGKTFKQLTILRAHATVHSTDKPHCCPTCGKSFKKLSTLTAHKNLHLPENDKRRVSCDVCNKAFASKRYLSVHRKSHTGERNFVCDICGKPFLSKVSLAQHLLIHAGKRSYVCTTCDYAFNTPQLLHKHSLIHSVIKPYQCDVCGKQFRQRSTLVAHSRVHSDDMPYTCEFCNKSFRYSGTLTIHRRQHTGERPYSCEECNHFFTNWANYNKHMKRIHQRDLSNPDSSRRRRMAIEGQKEGATEDPKEGSTEVRKEGSEEVRKEDSAECRVDL